MTEMRLIDWNRIFKEVEESLQENPHTTKEQRDMHNHEHNHFLCMLMEQPTINPEDLPLVKELREQLAEVTAADIAPVVHGEWLEQSGYITTADGSIPLHPCSNCGEDIALYNVDNYCPNCGAKMKTS